MISGKGAGLTLKELAELEECPCEVCTSQDNEDKLLDRQKLDEVG